MHPLVLNIGTVLQQCRLKCRSITTLCLLMGFNLLYGNIKPIQKDFWEHHQKRQFAKSVTLIKDALLQDGWTKAEQLELTALFALGSSMKNSRGKIRNLLENIEQSKDKFKEELKSDSNSFALLKLSEATLYFKLHQSEKSYQLLKEAEGLLKKTKPYPTYGIIQSKLAINANALIEPSTTINNYLEEASRFFMMHQDTLRTIRNFLTIEMKDHSHQNKKIIEYYEEALRLAKLKLNDNALIGTIYFKLGKAYRRSTNFGYANENYENGIRLLSNDDKLKDSKLLTNLKYFQAHNLLSMGFPEKALKSYQEVLENYTAKGIGPLKVAEVEFKLAGAYRHLKQYEKSLELVKRTYETRKRILKNKNHWIIQRALKSMGEVYLLLNDLPNAERCFNEALIKTKIQGKSTEIVSNYRHLQLLEDIKGDFKKSLMYNDSALFYLGYNLANPKDKSQLINTTMLIDAFEKRIQWLNKGYLNTAEVAYLKEGREHVKRSLSLFDEVLISVSDQESKLNLYKVFYNIFDNSLSLYHSLVERFPDEEVYFKEALLVSDKSRDIVLREKMLKKELSKNEEFESLLSKEKHLSQIIEDLELQKYDLIESNREETKKMTQVENKIFEITGSLNEVRNSLNKIYEEKLHFEIDIANFTQIENALETNTQYISFFYGSSFIYKLELFGKDHRFSKIKIDSTFEESINNFYRTLSNVQANQDWKTEAKEIYHTLFPEPFQSAERIKIIADGPLTKIPFEILFDPKSEQMLIENHLVSYSNSFISYANFEKLKSKASKGFAGFAPEYRTFTIDKKDTLNNSTFALLVRSGNYHLPGAQDEVKKISALVDGDEYIKEASNKQQFLESANDYRVLHLSMHALLESENPEYSRLLFNQGSLKSTEDYSIFINELGNLNLNARLAVLSACNTGSGKFKKGEGKISLSRAFNYAGVPSTVHSLWKVPDEATSKIMYKFYEELKSGKAIDASLRNAKLYYLQENLIPETAHPFYWAGFILDGKVDPIDFSKTTTSYWKYFLLSLVGIILLFGVLKFKS